MSKETINLTSSTNKAKLGVVCAFIEEHPAHSKYNVKTLVEGLGDIDELKICVISNGCNVSNTLREFLRCQPSTLFIEISTNIGLPAAWNLGIDLLDCDYIFFLNDDLWVDRQCIHEIVKVFESHPDSAVVGVEGVCCSTLGENGFPVTDVKYRKKKGLFPRQNKRIIDVTNVSGFLFAVSMNFIRKTRFRFDALFSPAFCEEFDIAFFARNHGYKTRIITGLDKHYDHAFGISSGPKEIYYLGKSIWSNYLSERNIKLFCQKWGANMFKLIKP